jgi:SAM-dependent methyltransferase
LRAAIALVYVILYHLRTIMTELQAMPDIAGWDTTVDAYVAYAERDTGAFAAPMLALADVRPGENALDVAAGTGALTLPLIGTRARVTAIDWSPGMAAYLRRRLDKADPGHQHAVHAMDGQALEFDDGAFDAALSLFGVMLFPDFRAGLAEMTRVTRPGGRCVVGSWAGLTAPMRLLQEAAAAALPDLPPTPAVPGMDAMATADGMTAELERFGLTGIRTEQVTLPWSASRAKIVGYADRMFAQMPPWRTLSVDDRASTHAAMRDLAERHADAPFESTALIGVGYKPGR